MDVLQKMSQTGSNGGGANGSGSGREIVIQITGQDGNTTAIRISRELRFRVLFDYYCKRKQLEQRTARFFHEGDRVLGRYTPAELNLEDGAELSCMIHQLGGGFYTLPSTT